MAAESIPTIESAIPGIGDLFAEIPQSIYEKSYAEKPTPLADNEIGYLTKLRQAAANTHSAAQMGLDVVAHYTYLSQEGAGDAKLNELSALVELLSEIVHYARESEVGAMQCQLRHHEAIADREKSEYVEIPVVTDVRGKKRKVVS